MITIIFDVDDTLYNLMEPFERAHQELFASRTGADCEQLFMASRIYSDEAFYMHEKGLISAEEEFAYRIRKTYADVGIEVTGELAAKFEERYRYYQKHIHVPEGVQEILDYCKGQDIPIGALTNGKHKYQNKKAQTLGLDRWFSDERIFISEDIGYTKPNPNAFFAVQQALQLDSEKTWFIGDTFEVDVEGAKKAGWHVIWFNHRHRQMPEGEIRADREVFSEKELLEVIEEITK
ncbi:MAG: HAD family hydrolase [Lachnospiraceae bacterium]|nr:HAD family hydrolase [Lachnospiraceae bacterium]